MRTFSEKGMALALTISSSLILFISFFHFSLMNKLISMTSAERVFPLGLSVSTFGSAVVWMFLKEHEKGEAISAVFSSVLAMLLVLALSLV